MTPDQEIKKSKSKIVKTKLKRNQSILQELREKMDSKQKRPYEISL